MNVDRVLRVAHIVAPGETIAANGVEIFAGGKGANQSVALARAGTAVAHVGRLGSDALWLRDKLAAEGVDTTHLEIGDEPSGQALIQVDDTGQNAIVILAGANGRITPQQIDRALDAASPGDWLLAQNETNGVAPAIRAAKERNLRVAFNPAPCTDAVRQYPLELVDLLCVNESEAAALVGKYDSPAPTCAALARLVPRGEMLLTLGAAGALRYAADAQLHQQGVAVTAVDTTAAGDTFLGYYLAGLVAGLDPPQRLARACRAAALCVTRPGALDSIPDLGQVDAFG